MIGMTNWKPGDSIGLKLDQINDEIVDVTEMLNAINAVIVRYGFKIRQSGEWSMMRSAMADEQKYIDELPSEARE